MGEENPNGMVSIRKKLSGLLTEECARRGILPAQGLVYWRERILLAVLGTAVLLSALAAVPAFFLALEEKLWTLLILDCSAFLLGVSLLLLKRLSYNIRASIVVMGFYGLGVSIIFNAGIMSGGPVWLFTFGAMAGLLIGVRAAIMAVLLNAVTLAALGSLYYSGHLGATIPYYLSGLRAFTAGANFVVLNLIVASAAAVMVRGIEFAADKERDISRFLSREKDLLLEARKHLQQEVTSRTEAERIARESELKYRLIADNLSDIIWTIDLTTMRYEYMSPSVLRVRGFSQEEAMEMSMEETLSPSSFQEVKGLLSLELAREGSPGVDPARSSTVEVEQRKKDGSFGWVEVTVTFMRDDIGRPSKMLGVSRDITERRRTEAEKKELERRLHEAKKMDAIATLAGGVAHQFNNALSVVGLSIEAIEYPSSTAEKRSRYLNNIKAMKDRMVGLTAQLLGYARGGRYQPREIAAGKLVSSALELTGDLVKEAPVTMEKDIPDGLHNVNVDVTQLQMVLSALIANASEAIEGEGKITVRCRNIELPENDLVPDARLEPGRYVCIMIQDNGKGMDTETLSRVFEPFFSTKFQGRGLGMAAVYGIVRNHGGHIEVESAPDLGTTVRIYLKSTD